MEEEWAKQQKERLPDLCVVRELDQVTKMPIEDDLSFLMEEVMDGSQKRTKKLGYQQGYDGEITSMSFNHVVKDKMFQPTSYATE